MRKVNCPRCESPAVSVSGVTGSKYYCDHCGWNLEPARSELTTSKKASFWLAAIGVILAVVVFSRNPNEPWGAVAIVFAFCGLPLFYAIQAWLQLRRLRNLSFLPEVLSGGALTVSQTGLAGDSPSTTTVFKQKEFPELTRIPRPRKLRMTWKGRGYLAIAVLAVSLYTLYGLPASWSEFNNPNSKHARDWTLAIPMVVVYGYSLAFLRNRLRERQLLSNGDLTSGYVIAQNNGRYVPSIQYCFTLSGGRLITARCTDVSRSLYEGMTVPVFYDTSNPEHSMPLDCSLTKIVSS
jgi:hypothetical protein